MRFEFSAMAGRLDTFELDPERLKAEFVPKYLHAPRGAVPGREFGQELAAGDRAALVAFLKTL
jgi:cytochrome c2